MTMPLLALCVSLFVLIVPSIIIYKLWWNPLRLQRLMKSQGIRGPSYKFFHGNTKEITRMQQQQQSSETAMDLSHDIFPRVQPHFYSWIKLYGDNFIHWIGCEPEIVITEPELIKEILINKDGTFPKSKAKGYIKKLLGDGLVVTEGEKWVRLRKLSNHAFHGDCLKEMVPTMTACVESMLEKWSDHVGKEMEVCRELKLLTSEVISRTAFGSSYLEGRRIFDMLIKIAVLFSRNRNKVRILGIGNLIRTQDEIEGDKTKELLHDSIMEIVRMRQEQVRRGEVESFGSDFLGSLLRSHHDQDPKNQISAESIIDECKTFYFAGQETTYSLLSWTIMLLAIHKEWQDKAREEVFRVFGQQNPNSEGLARLKTVNMILYETMRLYGPVTFISRRTSRRVKLGKYKFPANMRVAILPLAVHRNPEIWGRGDAHLFKPERFGEGLAKANNGSAMAFLGFGFGPRTCVGLNFAINVAKIAMSMILQRYEFTLSSKYVHSPSVILIAQPQHGVHILLQPL